MQASGLDKKAFTLLSDTRWSPRTWTARRPARVVRINVFSSLTNEMPLAAAASAHVTTAESSLNVGNCSPGGELSRSGPNSVYSDADVELFICLPPRAQYCPAPMDLARSLAASQRPICIHPAKGWGALSSLLKGRAYFLLGHGDP